MSAYEFFLGCDSSKDKLNFALADAQGQILYECEVPNQLARIRAKLKELLRIQQVPVEKVLLCVESTGVYNNWLLRAVSELEVATWVVHPHKITKTLEPLRGKSDDLDARRIAQFARRYADQARLYQQPKPEIRSLKRLLRLRQKLVKDRTRYKNRLKAAKNFDGLALEVQVYQSIIETLDEKIKEVEKQMRLIIRSNQRLKKRIKLLRTIPGVGFVSACTLLLFTNDFEDFDDPRKFACHAGAAPFPYASGKYARAHTTSNRAQKFIKGILSAAAKAASKSNSRLGAYFRRKMEEGKPESLVLNNLRNKIIHIAFAIIRTEKPYDDNHIPEAFAA